MLQASRPRSFAQIIWLIWPDIVVQVTLTLSNDPRTMDLPKEYDLNFFRNNKPDYVFSCKNSGIYGIILTALPIWPFLLVPVAVEGKVEHECHLRPKISEDYSKMMRKRFEETNKAKRSIQLVDAVNNGIHIGLIPHVGESDLINKVFLSQFPLMVLLIRCTIRGRSF